MVQFSWRHLKIKLYAWFEFIQSDHLDVYGFEYLCRTVRLSYLPHIYGVGVHEIQ